MLLSRSERFLQLSAWLLFDFNPISDTTDVCKDNYLLAFYNLEFDYAVCVNPLPHRDAF